MGAPAGVRFARPRRADSLELSGGRLLGSSASHGAGVVLAGCWTGGVALGMSCFLLHIFRGETGNDIIRPCFRYRVTPADQSVPSHAPPCASASSICFPASAGSSIENGVNGEVIRASRLAAPSLAH